ncbi:alveolar macrophage chemotactic factor [Rhinichthys klamathensis goyatoka]|uniref:alveolar macrophage chemotactic factor n=1 Tax=Rhinichthys klamathensis goyatoka TaxID=3034132 RepID=UPI0024B556AD|nr:alveolar macrophage chemotactic factor [Rhinichthys klamathensis goyatoka]
MSLNSYLLLAAIAVCCFTTHMAFPMDGFATNKKCQCLATTSAVIPPRLFQKIEILPPGAHCRKIEILITKKDNKTVCINPEARWINNIISKVMRSKRAVKETAVPTAA